MDLDKGVDSLIINSNIKFNNPFIYNDSPDFSDISFNRILILSSNINININKYKTFNNEEYKKFSENLYIIEADTNLLKINHHYQNTFVVNYDHFKIY